MRWLGFARPWMAPLGILELAAMVRLCKTRAEQVRCWDEVAQGKVPTKWVRWSDVVMISGLTPSRLRTEQLAGLARAAGKIVIGGGRDVSGRYLEGEEAALLGTFHAICVGCCSVDLMAQILLDIETRAVAGKVYQLPPGAVMQFVKPVRDLLRRVKYFARHTVRSSGGCNNGCLFCTVTERWTAKPLAMLKEELDELLRLGCRFFLDTSDNFLGNLRSALEIIRLYGEKGMPWGTEASVKKLLARQDGRRMINHMAEAGCRLIYIGVEDTTSDQVKGNKGDAEKLILLARELGVIVIGALILDLNGDEDEVRIRTNAKWAARWLDFAQFSLVALLAGSILRINALRYDPGLIIDHDPEHYDGSWPTMRHAMSPEERLKWFHWAYRYFGRPSLVWERVRRASRGWKLGVLAAGIRYAVGRPSDR